jgi:pyruvate dehydrogenase E2 component (dihydrolipoamide acetyltransferase)
MPHEITMPHLTDEVDEGVVVTWFVVPGQEVHAGQIIAELQVEKVSSELASPVDGEVAELRAAPGAVVGFGEVIAVIGDAAPTGETPPAGALPGEERPAAPRAPVRSSPSARRLARELDVDLSRVSGSGPGGRIVEDDVRAAAAGGPPAEAPTEGQPMPALRRTMADKLHGWTQQTAQFTITAEADVTELAEGAAARRAAGGGWGYLEAVVRACALALPGHQLLGTRLTDERRLVPPEAIDIGVAVAVEDGLLVPVLRAADGRSLDTLHGDIQTLAARARDGSLELGDQQGAVLSVTNLGGHRVDAFTPLLAPGQSAILGMGRARRRPAVVDDRIVPRTLLVLSLTVDHRLIDGVPAAAFLDEVVGMLEQPELLETA